MTFHEFDTLPVEKLKQELYRCCGSTTWVNNMVKEFPAEDLIDLFETAEEQWNECSEEDWKEAFRQHAKIGDLASAPDQSAGNATWAASEQKEVQHASPGLLTELAAANEAYEKKFGYVFVVSATGKTGEQILEIMKQRLANAPEVEIMVAKDEQHQITLIRLEKLIT